MAVTIKDVAKKAEVSTATVSLVINNHPAISEATRRRVLKTIEELGYHPRASARTLATRKTGNVGFILTEDHFSRSEPFYTKIFLGSEFEARDRNFYILLTTIPQNFDEKQHAPRFLLERNVDALILAGKVPTSLLDYVQRFRLPTVLVDYWVPGYDLSAVLIDNISGAREAVAYLVQKGHQRIAFLGGDLQHPSIKERLQGYRLALAEYGMAVDEALIVTDQPNTGFDDGEVGMRKLLEKNVPFTAVFAGNDAMAIGAMRVLRERGLHIPDDVAVIGFDDTEAAALVTPPLTTVHVDKVELGAAALRCIVDLAEARRKKCHKILIPTHLVIRESSG
ncbi:MAG: LacI family DNA-binding transcriptional regulator [candidate division KSB1 bacterium]|nr:LacI family DNA-binding transcriptional regulator [candidate division KSB1 bacterium]